eukprot:52540-Pyramimonas_sp.AAC.1
MEVFSSFESWDCEETDKQKFRALKAELEQYQAAMADKSATWQAFVDKVKLAQQEITERMAKKRKGNDGSTQDQDNQAQGATGAAAPAAPTGAAAGEATAPGATPT